MSRKKYDRFESDTTHTRDSFIKHSVSMFSANDFRVFGNLDIMLVDENKFSEAFLTSIGQIKRVA